MPAATTGGATAVPPVSMRRVTFVRVGKGDPFEGTFTYTTSEIGGIAARLAGASAHIGRRPRRWNGLRVGVARVDDQIPVRRLRVTPGTTIDPLRYNCGNDAPTCGQVGESYGYYNGTNVDLLYSENYYCDTAVPSHAATGCEVGAGPSSRRSDGTVPRRYVARQHDPRRHALHPGAALQPAPRRPSARPQPPASTTRRPSTCRPSPARCPVTRRPRACTTCRSRPTTTWSGPATAGCPEWWNVQVIATTDPATFATLTSVSAIDAAVAASKAVSVPTNAFLFFQVLAGTVPAAQAADLGRYGTPRTGRRHGPGRTTGQPGRARHDDRQPAQRLRGHGAELPGHRHQPRLDRGPGRRRPLHGAVLLRHHRGHGALVDGL